jgi:hypothetical protein
MFFLFWTPLYMGAVYAITPFSVKVPGGIFSCPREKELQIFLFFRPKGHYNRKESFSLHGQHTRASPKGRHRPQKAIDQRDSLAETAGKRFDAFAQAWKSCKSGLFIFGIGNRGMLLFP